MVTVIADKEDLRTPVDNGVNRNSNEHERPFQYVKDYQEVDFHRSPSCKPLPEDLFGTGDGHGMKSSIHGTFMVQIEAIESLNQSVHDGHQNEQTHANSSLLLTVTDGMTTVQGMTNDTIPNLSCNVKCGCKLLLTGAIPIENGCLQLTADNTRFQYGSNTYPRPRSAYRGRGGGSYRPSYEGRRGGGGGNSSSRYDNDDGESNFFKRPPPKNTLMDFMTSFKIVDGTKAAIDDENTKFRENHDQKRRYHETHQSISKPSNGTYASNPNHSAVTNKSASTDPSVFQQDDVPEQADSEEDPSHANLRERRNPLPPRLQRAQEERSRRNTNRYYDESNSLVAGDTDGHYSTGPANNSSSSFVRRMDPAAYISNNSSGDQQHLTAIHPFAAHPSILSAGNGSGPAHLAYFHPTPTPLPYNLAGMSSSAFQGRPLPMGPPFPNDHFAFFYGSPYAAAAYLPAPMGNGFNGATKPYHQNHRNTSAPTGPSKSSADEIETKPLDESQPDENSESAKNSQSTSIEPKVSSSANEANSQPAARQHPEEKRRDVNANPRPRWKIGDTCLARWSEDREFYTAEIVHIQPPYCTVLFRDYNNYAEVHFGDLRMIPRDQSSYSSAPQAAISASDLNPLAPSVYFPAPTSYQSPAIDGSVRMPEAPPFPFNSAGTLYMCPPAIPPLLRSNRYSNTGLPAFAQQSNRRVDNGNSASHTNGNAAIYSSSSPSKDSNDSSTNESATTASNEDHQEADKSQSNAEGQSRANPDVLPSSPVKQDQEHPSATNTGNGPSSHHDEPSSAKVDDAGKNQDKDALANGI